MNDQMRNWLRRGGIAFGIFVAGALVGWMFRGVSGHIAVSKIYVYDDWRVVCPADSEAKSSCRMGTVSVNSQSGERLTEVSIGYDEGNLEKRTLALTVPAGVLIQPGLGMQLGPDTKTYPYATCTRSDCIAIVPLDDKLLDTINSAPSINLVVAVQGDRTVPLTVSLKGYKEARDAMNSTEAKRHSWWRRLWS